MRAFIGRHTDKSFDWDAFPGSRGFPDLARAQMRYIGAGGSPKADDPSTLKPGQFTLSLVHQPVGKYAACHSHEVVEHFLVLQGVLTVGWAWGDEVIEVQLGPKDMVLNQLGRPHGFRNDGVEPVLMSISVGSGMPKPPVYVCHPRDSDAAIARHFGAGPGKTHAFDPDSLDPCRAAPGQALRQSTAGVGRARQSVYIGEGGAPPSKYRMARFICRRVCRCGLYARSRTCISCWTAALPWAGRKRAPSKRVQPAGLGFTRPARSTIFATIAADATFSTVGTAEAEDIRFHPA
jgi:mannose-6-phosphate isomerase-like protein (cupin superfamily)